VGRHIRALWRTDAADEEVGHDDGMPRLVDYSARCALIQEVHDDLILERGIATLTMTSVAERAGMSLATVRRITPTLAGLHLGSYLWWMRRRYFQRISYPGDLPPIETAVHCIEHLLPIAPKSRDGITVMKAIESVAAPGSKLQEAIEEHLAAEIHYVSQVLRLLGEPDEVERLHLVALVRGLIEAMLQTRVDEESAKQVVRRHLGGFASRQVEAVEAG
jgi:AcrR family transcriptional regulator